MRGEKPIEVCFLHTHKVNMGLSYRSDDWDDMELATRPQPAA
jgi:hypothetical protein